MKSWKHEWPDTIHYDENLYYYCQLHESIYIFHMIKRTLVFEY